MTGPDPRIIAAGTAPTPFTADEIRSGCPPGRVMVVATERPGEAPILREIRFVATDADTAIQRFTPVDVGGMPIGESELHTSSWLDLQAHASFPADRTTITSEEIETPLGTLDCLRYEVEDGDVLDTYWFSHVRPGMPVRFARHEDGQLAMVATVIVDRVEA